MHILMETLKGKENLEGLGVEGRKILKCILKKDNVTMWTGFNWLEIRSSGGLW
jgi:hypothetical protein